MNVPVELVMRCLTDRLHLYVNYNRNNTYYSLASWFGDFIYDRWLYSYITRGGHNYDSTEVD
jgi:hypothetical protein